MNKWLKRSLVGAGAVCVLVAGSLTAGSVLADRKAHRVMTLAALPVSLPSDAQSLQRGAYLFASRGCAECHGATGAGRVFASDGDALVLKSPDITRGPGGVTGAYADADSMQRA